MFASAVSKRTSASRLRVTPPARVHPSDGPVVSPLSYILVVGCRVIRFFVVCIFSVCTCTRVYRLGLLDSLHLPHRAPGLSFEILTMFLFSCAS